MKNTQEDDRSTARHRATVLRRERCRQALERLLGWRTSAYYQRLRVYYRRWRHLVPVDFGKGVYRRDSYAVWVQEESKALLSVRAYAERIAALAVRPTVSILIPIHTPYCSWLEDSLSSVLGQIYPHWELWLCVADASTEVHSLLERYREREPRIHAVRLQGERDSGSMLNHGLRMAGGEFLGLLGQHDTLAPHALYEIAMRLQTSHIDVFYSDEDVVDAQGRRSEPFFKPDWSPDLCLSSLYACHFGVYRRELVSRVGGFRAQCIESAEYDLLLRCAEQSERIVHLPRVLYHKRQSPGDTPSGRRSVWRGNRKVQRHRDERVHVSAKQVLRDTLARRGETAEVEDGPAPRTFHVRRRLSDAPLVSILIPTRDRLRLLRRCIQSIETKSTYRRYEIVIMDNGSQEPQTLEYLRSQPYRVIRDDSPFNFARLNNRAAQFASGEHLLLLNNDMEVITPGWLEALLEHSQRDEVGAVSGLLLYPDNTIQHAGVVLGVRGVAGHAHKYLPVTIPGYGCFPHLVRNYSAVTAACLMMRKAVYEEVGGMEEQLAVTFNDVDFCLRLRARRYLVVYTPHARLYHHESQSRWYQPPQPEEVQYMLDHWGPVIAQDPYYSPYLTLSHEDFRFDLDRARSLL